MSSQTIELRKPNPIDFADEDYGQILKQLQNNNQTSWIWDLLIKQSAPNATAEIRVNFTNEFNGEAVPIVVFVKSVAATEDKAAGTGAQSVIIFGIDSDGNPNFDIITLHAAAGTHITCLLLWKRIVGFAVYTAGAGGTNADTIILENAGGTEVYATIAAGESCSINARVYIPSGYSGFIGNMKGMVLVVSDATAEEVYGDGLIVEPIYVKSSVTRLKLDEYFVNVDSRGLQNLNVHKELVVGANTYYISLKHVTKADDNNRTAIYNLKIIMYKQRIV